EPGDERADLAAVLAAIAERHRRLGIDVRLALAPRLGTVAMGEETLDTILSNLLENARQHGGPGIGVTIRAARDGVRASVRVEDDGPGVSPGNAARVFDPPRARDGVLRVPELEGAAPLREVRGRDARAEDVRPALRADLEDDVVVEGVHREAGAGEHGAQGEPGRRAVRVEAALLQLHGEGAGLEAARGILEVGEAVAVVVDAVAANLGRRRVGPEASSGVVDVGVNARAASAAVGGAGVVVVAEGRR